MIDSKLLNSDGTPSFTTINQLHDSFEEAFAKKHLAASMKDIIIKATPLHADKSSLFEDDNVKKMLDNSVNEVAAVTYDNKELGGNTFIGQVRETVNEYAGLEADYRMDQAIAVLQTDTDRVEASNRVRDIFSIENLNFTSDELRKRFLDEMEYKHSAEAEDIVTEIGKDVAEAISTAEEKNIIINETAKAISDEKAEMEKELQVSNDEDSSSDDTSTDDTSSDETDTGDETEEDPDVDGANDDAGEGDVNDDEVGEEGYTYSSEALILTRSRKAEAIDWAKKHKSDITDHYYKAIIKLYEVLAKKEKELKGTNKAGWIFANSGEPITLNYDTKAECEKAAKDFCDKIYNTVCRGKTFKGKFKIGSIRDMNVAKTILSILGLSFLGLAIVILTDKNVQDMSDTFSELGDNKDKSFGKVVIRTRGGVKGKNFVDDVIIYVKLRLIDIVNTQGLEDEEAKELITDLKEELDNAIEAGEVDVSDKPAILTSDIPPSSEPLKDENQQIQNVEVTNVADNDSTVVSNEQEIRENEDQKTGETEEMTLAIPDDPATSEDAEADTKTIGSAFAPATTVQDVGMESYRKALYSAENLTKVIIPLSPLKFDQMKVHSKNVYATAIARSNESFDDLRNIFSGRLNTLKDIIDKEQDEELTKKYESYSKLAMEAVDLAEVTVDSFHNVGITPFGIEDVNDPLNLYVGSKFAKLATGNYKVKNVEPKRKWETSYEGIDAVFDLNLLKKELRTAVKENRRDDAINLSKEVASREDLIYNNITKIENDDAAKKEIENLMQIEALELGPEIIVKDEFLTKLDLALETTKVKGVSKSQSEINDDIYAKAINRCEFMLGKEPDQLQKDIIKAMIENRDTSDFNPSVYEQFIIKEAKDKADKTGDDYSLGGESADLLCDKAALATSLYTFVNKCNPMDEQATESFNEYLLEDKNLMM